MCEEVGLQQGDEGYQEKSGRNSSSSIYGKKSVCSKRPEEKTRLVTKATENLRCGGNDTKKTAKTTGSQHLKM